MPPAGYPAFLQYLQSGRVRNSRQAVLLPETCVGHIDRRTQEGSSRLHALLYACYPRLVNGYV